MSEPIAAFQARTHRLVNSRYPPIDVFEGHGSPVDIAAALELEGATNDRLTRAHMIPYEDWAVGAGAGYAMAAFLHPSPNGGRFNGPELGAWYCSTQRHTAIKETVYHNTRRLRASAGGFPAQMQMRELVSTPAADLIDLRGHRHTRPDLYDLADYRRSQEFGEKRRKSGIDGIWYESVRAAGGNNVAIFKPRLLVPVIQGDHFQYDWDHGGCAQIHRLTNVA
ncbi:MAG TPA: RES family NAD+ phosphorylase [Alphaproteobacteria bacterium]|nr:RES family NAD+ phosphorylase [Alphaproteobacteria bacterium]